jgi:hypothetical protein
MGAVLACAALNGQPLKYAFKKEYHTEQEVERNNPAALGMNIRPVRAAGSEPKEARLCTARTHLPYRLLYPVITKNIPLFPAWSGL